MNCYCVSGINMKKSLCLVLGMTLLTAAVCTARQTEPIGKVASGKSDNTFLQENPGYQDRAGKYYEKEYLPKAMRQLAETVKLTEKQKAKAGKYLRSFICDWLGSFVKGGGKISRKDVARCLKLMDEKFHGELPRAGYQKYLAWRKGKEGENALGFLMDPEIDFTPTERDLAGINNMHKSSSLFVGMTRRACNSNLFKVIHVDISSVNLFFKGRGLKVRPLDKKARENDMVIPVDTEPYKYIKGEWNKIYLLSDNTIVNVFFSKENNKIIVSRLLLGSRGMGLRQIVNWPGSGKEVDRVDLSEYKKGFQLTGSIKEGMNFLQAIAELKNAGASDISLGIGYLPVAIRKNECPILRWYILPDKTCLKLRAVYVLKKDSSALVVKGLTVGEKGKGYGGKNKWTEQKTVMLKEIELKDYMANQLLKEKALDARK